MNDKYEFTIKRYPNTAGLKRGPNMQTQFCQCCQQEKTHGYWMYDGEGGNRVLKCSIFICDDCLINARKRG